MYTSLRRAGNATVTTGGTAEVAFAEEDGFMVGGHGMSSGALGCAQYGFAVVDSKTDGRLRVLYFEEMNATNSTAAYDDILGCVRARGVSGCSQHAKVWLDRPAMAAATSAAAAAAL